MEDTAIDGTAKIQPHCGAMCELQMSDDTHLKAYDEASKYVMRELSLINNRLTWILTIHGFLYATYGFNLQKQIDVAERVTELSKTIDQNALCDTLWQSQLFAFTIATVGLFISLFGYLSISAACKAMKAISDVFTETNSTKFVMKNDFGLRYYLYDGSVSFPHLLGGGLKSVNRKGNLASKSIPLVLLSSWIIALVGIVSLGVEAEGKVCKTKLTGYIYEVSKSIQKSIF